MDRRSGIEPAAGLRPRADLRRSGGSPRWRSCLIAIGAFFALGLHHYLSFEALRQHREELLALVEQHPLLAPLGFMGLYAAVIALSVPGGAVLTIAGGFLFGIVPATLLRRGRRYRRRHHRLPDRQDRARRCLARQGRAPHPAHGGRLSPRRAELPAGAAPDPDLPVLAGQHRAGVSRRAAPHLRARHASSASFRAASSMPASATAWARCSMPAARPISGSSSSPRSCCRSSGWQCSPCCRSPIGNSRPARGNNWTEGAFIPK